MKRYAIGDIHGGSKTFRALLDALSLRHTDRLYLLGDYIDRGNDSKGVLDTILGLREAGYNVTPILGNHDDMMNREFSGDHNEWSSGWIKSWGKYTLESFGVSAVQSVKTRYLTFLDSLPLVAYDEDFVFVHAGLNMDLDDPITQTDPTDMIWEKSLTVDRNRLGGRKLVVGHTIKMMKDLEASLETDLIQLDNGAYCDLHESMGCLVALNLDTMQLFSQRWLDGEAYG